MYRQAGGEVPSGVSRHGQNKRPPRASRTGKRRAQRPPQPRSAAAPHGETKKGNTEKTYKEAKLRPSTKAYRPEYSHHESSGSFSNRRLAANQGQKLWQHSL